jgi:hypothetical protein
MARFSTVTSDVHANTIVTGTPGMIDWSPPETTVTCVEGSVASGGMTASTSVAVPRSSEKRYGAGGRFRRDTLTGRATAIWVALSVATTMTSLSVRSASVFPCERVYLIAYLPPVRPVALTPPGEKPESICEKSAVSVSPLVSPVYSALISTV